MSLASFVLKSESPFVEVTVTVLVITTADVADTLYGKAIVILAPACRFPRLHVMIPREGKLHPAGTDVRI